jgi:hypothetical protein
MRKDIEVIREYCPKVKRYVIRTDSYGCSLGFLSMLFEEAKKDFPNLGAEEVFIKNYAGIRYARTFGIEFQIEGNVPEGYREIPTLEYTL